MLVYIISDVHIKYYPSSENQKIQEDFIRFINHCIEVKTDLLILNGDIFDLWYSWKTVIIKNYFPILKKLAELSENNCKIVYISGNHDFWFDSFLTDNMGAEIHSEFYTNFIDGKKIFVSHGDLYTSNDVRYRVFRKIIRTKVVKFLFEILHPNIGLEIGRKLSRSSRYRKISGQIKSQKENGLHLKANELFEDHDFVVFGHTHNPQYKPNGKKVYINTGDWLKHKSYAEIKNGNINLRYFN